MELKPRKVNSRRIETRKGKSRRPASRWLICLFLAGLPGILSAGTITLAGQINQSTQDGTGPAVNNPGLMSVNDGDSYLVTLSFTGDITTQGLFQLTGASFLDTSANIPESSFGSPWSINVANNGSNFDLSVLACLTTGSACNQGNFLAANFRIPAASLNAQNVTATPIPALLGFELIEDDGVTDIQGTVDKYSYSGNAAPVPEPAAAIPLCAALAAMAALRKVRASN
jgi:hypothetical protein